MTSATPTLSTPVAYAGRVAPKRRSGGRPRGTCGPVRQALMRAIGDGLAGTAEALAAATGWPPEHVRRTLWDMARAGDAALQAREQTGRGGNPPGLYGRPVQAQSVDALAHIQQAWR